MNPIGMAVSCFCVGLVVIGSVSCSRGGKINIYKHTHTTDREVREVDTADAEVAEDLRKGNLLKLFKENVHSIVRNQCKGCHDSQVAPYFATEDHVASYNTLVSGQKIDFANPVDSRIVKRLAEENHNCWSDCEANAEELTAAIVVVQEGVEAEDIAGESTSLAFTTTTAALGDIAVPSTSRKSLVVDLETGNITNDGSLSKEAEALGGYSVILTASVEDGSDGSWLGMAESGEASVIDLNMKAPPRVSRRVLLRAMVATFEVTAFAIQVDDNAPERVSITPPQQAAAYTWYSFSILPEVEGKISRVRIWPRESAIRFDRMVFLHDEEQDLDGATLDGDEDNRRLVVFDLEGDGHQLSMYIQRLSTTMFTASSPAIHGGGSPLTVTGLYNLVNNEMLPENAVFATVSGSTFQPRMVLSKSSSSLVFPEGDTYDLSVGVDELTRGEEVEQ